MLLLDIVPDTYHIHSYKADMCLFLPTQKIPLRVLGGQAVLTSHTVEHNNS